MAEDSLDVIAKVAALVAGAGAGARVTVAAHAGARGWRLVLEGVVGAALGLIAAAVLLYADPTLRDSAWRIFSLAGFCGLAGAMGTRGLDMLTAYLERQLKGAGK
jgi:hypothetical protein